jgi:hypothetical protein
MHALAASGHDGTTKVSAGRVYNNNRESVLSTIGRGCMDGPLVGVSVAILGLSGAPGHEIFKQNI